MQFYMRKHNVISIGKQVGSKTIFRICPHFVKIKTYKKDLKEIPKNIKILFSVGWPLNDFYSLCTLFYIC